MLMNKMGIAYLHKEELGLPLGWHVEALSEIPCLGIRDIQIEPFAQSWLIKDRIWCRVLVSGLG
jgi:hypothetical protein